MIAMLMSHHYSEPYLAILVENVKGASQCRQHGGKSPDQFHIGHYHRVVKRAVERKLFKFVGCTYVDLNLQVSTHVFL